MAKGRVDDYRLTARQDAPDFRDYIYQPALVNLAPVKAPPEKLNIRDQGQEGSCTGFGLAAVIDGLIREADRRHDGRAITVSTRMLYEMARRYDEWPGESYAGSSCRGAIKGWYNMGVCREEFYPNGTESDEGFTVAAAKDARNNTIGAYYRLGGRISDYHSALAEVGAIFCSANVHEGWEKNQVDSRTGLIPFREKSIGGHAFAIVGYDDQGFWIQNSWGKSWGKEGTALWSYEDWLVNVQDAWVFRMALPTPQIWHLPARNPVGEATAGAAPKPARAEIAGHFCHLDDGRFKDSGRYWSNRHDVGLTADLVAESDDYDHLLFYAHGGLNSPTDSARRIAAMKETFKANRIYPYHLMYDTGLLEELKDVITRRRQEADARAGGFTDWLDRLVEMATRVPGRALWREMKLGAERPFDKGMAGTETLAAFVDAFTRSGKPKKIHLLGHSTGMILLSHLLQRLSVLAPKACIDTVSMMAPAGTIELFTTHIQPFLEARKPAFRIAEMAVYNLSDKLEQDDEVTRAYNKSLLYLVSRAFEDKVPAPLLGMQSACKEDPKPEDVPRLKLHYSKGSVPGAQVTASSSHGGFDNDTVTMNHILRRILPSGDWSGAVRFTAKSLAY